jgi:hypothetical protein
MTVSRNDSVSKSLPTVNRRACNDSEGLLGGCTKKEPEARCLLWTSSLTATAAIYLATQILPAVLRAECVEVTQREAFRTAAIVVRGRVTRVENLRRFDPVDRESGKLALERASDPYVATLAVDQTWKGPLTSAIQVLAFGHPAIGTGFQFRVGSEFVVYALDEVNQDTPPSIRRFSGRSRVYGIGLGCVLRVRTDVVGESRVLGRGRSPQLTRPRSPIVR